MNIFLQLLLMAVGFCYKLYNFIAQILLDVCLVNIACFFELTVLVFSQTSLSSNST